MTAVCENVPLLKQSGADLVITSSSSAGRLLGMSMASPHVGSVLEDLLTYGSGLDLDERPVTRSEAGRSLASSMTWSWRSYGGTGC